jgi:hypothetical protein
VSVSRVDVEVTCAGRETGVRRAAADGVSGSNLKTQKGLEK